MLYIHREHYYPHGINTQNVIIRTKYTHRTLLIPRYTHKERYYSHGINTQNAIIPTVYTHKTLLFPRYSTHICSLLCLLLQNVSHELPASPPSSNNAESLLHSMLKMWNALSWLWLGFGIRVLWTCSWTFRCHWIFRVVKIRVIWDVNLWLYVCASWRF